MCPRSSITTPVPSRLEPRVVLLRALGMAFILTRTTAASISSASLSSSAWVCWDFWTRGLSLGSSAAAPPHPSSKAADTATIRFLIIVVPCDAGIVLLNGAHFYCPAKRRRPCPGYHFSMGASRGMSLFLNLGHTLDHLLMLIFPTVVLAMGAELGRGYADLLPLSLGGFIAFGAFSIPAGWLADRWSRRGLMVVFFFGIGTASILTGFATGPWHIALGLTLVGVFAAIYHPVGIAMLVCGVYLIAAVAQLCVGWWLDRRPLKSVFVPVVALQVPLLALAGTTESYLMLATAVAMMFFVFGQIPINDAMIARYTAEEWRARAYAVRYVVSFGASALAVPLVAWVYKSSGDFKLLYYVLGTLAFITFTAALLFPTEEEKATAKEMAA